MREFLRVVSAVVLLALLAVGCSTDSVDTDYVGGDTSGGNDLSDWSDPEGVVAAIDELLCTTYLYNEEYAAIENRDFTLAFDDFFYGYLTSLTTNKLDYKMLSSGEMELFSYVYCTAPDGTVRSSTMGSDFGFIYMTVVQILDGRETIYGIYVSALYDGSPAAQAGLRRGMVITEIDGVGINVNNYYNQILSLYYPSSGDSHSLTIYVNDEGEVSYKNATMTVGSYEMNPVLKYDIYESDGKSVGYINYNSFDFAYDSDLLTAFKSLRDGGAEELILDLRYNLGGYISSASMMTSAINATSTGDSQVFAYYRCNADLTADYINTIKWSGFSFDKSKGDNGLFFENLSGVNTQYQLNLTNKTVYCLVSYNTASASEMVINALKGMGYTVVLIGQDTRGKNAGMFISEYTFDGYQYEVAPISFENYNCLIEGGYEDGMPVTHYISQTDELNGFYDFGENEVLISTALKLIAGEPITVSVRSALSTSTAAVVQVEDGVVGLGGGRREGAMVKVNR